MRPTRETTLRAEKEREKHTNQLPSERRCCYQRVPEVHSNEKADTAGKTVLERLGRTVGH